MISVRLLQVCRAERGHLLGCNEEQEGRPRAPCVLGSCLNRALWDEHFSILGALVLSSPPHCQSYHLSIGRSGLYTAQHPLPQLKTKPRRETACSFVGANPTVQCHLPCTDPHRRPSDAEKGNTGLFRGIPKLVTSGGQAGFCGGSDDLFSAQGLNFDLASRVNLVFQWH